MKISDLKKRITEKSITIQVNTNSGVEAVRFPLLTVGDCAEVKRETGVDIWDLLLSVGAENNPDKIARMNEKDLEEWQRMMSISLLKRISQAAQKHMIFCSLRRVDPSASIDDVDYIITYGINQNEYVKLLNFLLYGLTSEESAKEAVAEKKEES